MTDDELVENTPQCIEDRCDKEADYMYENPQSGIGPHPYCARHLDTLRHDVPLKTWVEAGYAEEL